MRADRAMAYVASHEAWYWDACFEGNVVAEIYVQNVSVDEDGVVDRGGGCHWEFAIRWHDHGEHGTPPQVEIFNDAWQAFHEIPEFFGKLATLADKATVHVVIDMLVDLGWTDLTTRSDRRAS
jgi:hypothetical protein